MKRQKQAQKIGGQMKEFLEKNPAIKEALRVFDISYDQYQKAMESGLNFYTDSSTSPQDVKLKKPI
jgi:methionyl-tRNA synthetase